MLISEASKLLSEELGDYITDNFIRFYDNKVLNLGRVRGNKYREITDDDIRTLKKVYVLSKIGIPVTVIKSYLSKDKEAMEFITKRKAEIVRLLKGGQLDEF